MVDHKPSDKIYGRVDYLSLIFYHLDRTMEALHTDQSKFITDVEGLEALLSVRLNGGLNKEEIQKGILERKREYETLNNSAPSDYKLKLFKALSKLSLIMSKLDENSMLDEQSTEYTFMSAKTEDGK